METAHPLVLKRIALEWNEKGLNFNVYETLELIEWTTQYSESLRRFGINDEGLDLGNDTLHNAYQHKVHMQITPLLVNILKNQRFQPPDEDEHHHLYTQAPEAVFKLFGESLAVVRAQRLAAPEPRLLSVMQSALQQY